MPYYDRKADYLDFSSRYGHVRLVLVTDVLNVNEVRWDIVPEECHISMNKSEKVILISQGQHLQPFFEPPLTEKSRFAIAAHVSASEVRLCRVAVLAYNGPEDAQEEISRLNQQQGPVI